MKISQLSWKVKHQLTSFVGNLPICKTAKRFSVEMLYGFLARGSLRLTEVARSLDEKTRLIKTVTRLSRQLKRPGMVQAIHEYVIRMAANRIDERTLLVLDPSDLTKPYARKMEHLAKVRDGSTGQITNGYWLCQVIGVECGGHEIIPLVNHLWSHEAPDFRGENEEILRCVDVVRKHVGQRGIWVIDRGADRIKLFGPFLKRGLDFIIRLVGNRMLLYKGQAILAEKLIEKCKFPFSETIIKQNPDGTERNVTIEFGYLPVRLPNHPDDLNLLIIKGFGETPLMVLTTLPLRKNRTVLWWVVEAYLTRWRIEETLRCVKQSYQLEDVRVQSYRRLRNMMALVLLTMYFVMVQLGQQTQLAVLAHHALTASRRLFGIPNFRYYALTDGLREILSKCQSRPFRRKEPRSAEITQISFLCGLGP